MKRFFLILVLTVALSFSFYVPAANVAMGYSEDATICTDENDPDTCYSDVDWRTNILLQEDSGVPYEEVTEQEQQQAQKEKSFEIKKQAADLNPLNITGPEDLFGIAINVLMAFIGSIALILYIYSGFLWMSAGGNDEKIKKATTILVWTTLGAIVMGGSYMVVRTVLEKVG